LVGILEGLPAHLPVDAGDIDRDLTRRQQGYGRGGRMRIEKDAAEILSGLRFGQTLGSPVSLLIRNKDWANWTERMAVAGGGPDQRPVLIPRPGHADLAGGLKYEHTEDLRNVLERASARETAMRVGLGALAKALLRDLGVEVGSYVRSIGGVEAGDAAALEPELFRADAEALALKADLTQTRALTKEASGRLEARIDEAMRRRDTVGGVVEVVVTHVPVGLGSYVQADRKLDGRLAQALMQVPAIKAVEVGDGFLGGARFGSEQHDPILWQGERLGRSSNHAGGLEGGVTNGEPLVLRAVMKPISTVSAALPSVNLKTLGAVPAHVERSDTCAVPAAGVVVEAAVALALADAVLEALGGDTMAALRAPFAKLRVAARRRVGQLFLLGPMGAGKSSAGRLLAAQLGLPFVDLDSRIEQRAGATIAQIFQSRGEAAFRDLESQELRTACEGSPAVVALGGGAVLTDRAWQKMREAGVTVRLHAPVDVLAARLRSEGRPLETRPLLAGGDPSERLPGLLRERERWYARADLSLKTEGLAPEAVAYAVRGLVQSLEGPLAGTGAP
jgi:chorismate synthase